MRIPLIPGLMIAAVALVANLVSCIILFVVSIPKNFWQTLRYSLSVMITAYPQSVRQFLKLYDANGLRHHISHLNDNRTRKKIAIATVAEQCQYVDIVTRRNFPKNSNRARKNNEKPQYMPLFPLTIHDQDSFINTPPIIPGPLNIEMDMTQINTTSIGNIAWVSLYHPGEDQRDYCKQKLQEIRDYFIIMQ